MTGGIIQLVAQGVQDLFLSQDPQITYFKSVFRRHTNFSTEVIPQYFTQTCDFGKKTTCILSKSGDLVSKIYVVIKLPKLSLFVDNNGYEDILTKIAWAKKIGFVVIKMMEIEIGGQTIDRQYGEWLNIWHEITGPFNKNYLKMIGLHENINEYEKSKEYITLYIPLQFWFCRHRGLALPILNLHFNDVKINIEFSNLNKCLNTTPTHWIKINNDIVNFTESEYIEQTVDNNKAFGIFRYYDTITKKMYYHKLSNIPFISISNTTITNITELNNVVYDINNEKYLIHGRLSETTVMPYINATEMPYFCNMQRNISITECFLLVDYIFLDEDERITFMKSSSEYLIEQVNATSEKTINSINSKHNLEMKHPVKLLVFLAQLTMMKNVNVNDHFNYTDDYQILKQNIFNEKPYKFVGKNLIDMATILLNSQERLSLRHGSFYNWIQPYQHFMANLDEGINVYSFCLFPEKYQPSGTCNMSKIDNIAIQIKVKNNIDFANDAKFRSYYVNYNILRIINGMCYLVFTD